MCEIRDKNKLYKRERYSKKMYNKVTVHLNKALNNVNVKKVGKQSIKI